MRHSLMKALLLTSICVTPAMAQDSSVEVLHWWTSGGEAAAVGVLKDTLQAQGVTWQDMPVAGGGGEQAMTVLRARVTAGNPPTAVQMLGFDITDWAAQGVLANLNELAASENWDAVVPPALQAFAKYDGTWIAAPVNVHSTNWVWANKAIFDELGIGELNTWEDLIAALDKIKAAGYIPIAHGGQAWQDATMFDSIVLTTGGPAFYKAAFNDLDPAALNSDTMRTAFERLVQLRDYADDNFSGRDWNIAMAMVIEGKAGMQFTGDWAKGEFRNAGKTAGTDFLCFRFPGTQGSVTFNSDMFAMFEVGEERRAAQLQLASDVMDPAFQSAFNVVKGSVPARTDVPDTDLDPCGKKGMADLAEASASGSLMGSMAHGYGAPSAVKLAVYDVVTGVFNGAIAPADAPAALADAVAAAQ